MSSKVKTLSAMALMLCNFSCRESSSDKTIASLDGDRASLTNCKLPVADANTQIALGFPRHDYRLKSEGTVVATVIMVDFPDAQATKTPEKAFELISGASDTFTEMSYGRMNFTFNTTYHWYRMAKNSAEYEPMMYTYDGHKSYIEEAIKLANDDVDFSKTDVLVILANPDAVSLGNRGPAFTTSVGGGVVADGKELVNVVTSAYDLNNWGSIWLNHEVTHTLGMVDLYAYEKSDWYDSIRFTGEYSYMGFNSFKSNSPGLTAWERWLIGWIDDDQMTCANPYRDGRLEKKISPIATAGGTKAVVVPVSATKAVVIESRRADGIDAKIHKTGALVYTVDTTLSSGTGVIKVYPQDSGDPSFLNSTRAKSELVRVEGLIVEVLKAEDDGDTVRVIVDPVRQWM